jgi:hypothetical protein
LTEGRPYFWDWKILTESISRSKKQKGKKTLQLISHNLGYLWYRPRFSDLETVCSRHYVIFTVTWLEFRKTLEFWSYGFVAFIFISFWIKHLTGEKSHLRHSSNPKTPP